MATVRFSLTARADITAVLLFSQEHFGDDARRRYERLLAMALRDLADDPQRAGSVDRSEIGVGVRSFHLRHSRGRSGQASGVVHRPRHFILYRSIRPDLIGVGRLLHDAMEIERHIPASYGDEEE